MSKRSTNLSGGKRKNTLSDRRAPGHILSIAQWLGMSDEEVRAMAEEMAAAIAAAKKEKTK